MGLTCIKARGMTDGWVDSMACADFDGKIQGIAPVQAAVTPTSLHYVWNYSGTRLSKFTAPFPAIAEMMVSKILTGKLVAVGGNTGTQAWEFDPTVAGYAAGSWSQIGTLTYEGGPGLSTYGRGCDLGGWFYRFGGTDNNHFYRTQTFENDWEDLGELPANLTRWAAGAICSHKGKAILVGGVTNVGSPFGGAEAQAAEVMGYVYEFDPADDSFTLLATDQLKFGSMWCDIVSDGSSLFAVKGFISAPQYDNFYVAPPAHVKRGLNNRGVFKSTDDGTTWSEIAGVEVGADTFCERHATGGVAFNSVAHFLTSNFCNDLWSVT
jgi:hypothetical protein